MENLGPLDRLKQYLNEYPRADLQPEQRLDHPFTLEGTKEGFYDHVATGSASYYVTPPANQEYVIERMLVYGEDANFSNAAQYGG
ncbi:hypothetical protein LCGC14_2299610, partial [marine sediment metagenome]